MKGQQHVPPTPMSYHCPVAGAIEYWAAPGRSPKRSQAVPLSAQEIRLESQRTDFSLLLTRRGIGITLGCRHNQCRETSISQNRPGDGTHYQLLEVGEPMCAQNNQIHKFFPRQGHDFLGRQTNFAQCLYFIHQLTAFIAHSLKTGPSEFLDAGDNLTEPIAFRQGVCFKATRIHDVDDNKLCPKRFGIVDGQFARGFSILGEISAEKDFLWWHDVSPLLPIRVITLENAAISVPWHQRGSHEAKAGHDNVW